MFFAYRHTTYKSSQSKERGGADFLMICTYTMHKVVAEIEAQISIPELHIADATAQALLSKRVSKVGLLGTRFTIEQAFYKGRLTEHFGIDVVVPDAQDRTRVHDIIDNELCLGVIKNDSRTIYLEIINKLHNQGAEAVILGCTEIALLVNQSDTPVPLYDTTYIHAAQGIDWALQID